MKLIKVSNYNPKWFFTIAVHDKSIASFPQFFLRNQSKPEKEILTFYVIAFATIKIQKHSAPQNDRLNLSFVKDKYVKAKNG